MTRRISLFDQGRRGFVYHGYTLDGMQSKFSVWFNRDGFAIDAQRIDSRGRSYPVLTDSPTWRAIERYRIAGLEGASEIERKGGARD